MPPRIPLKAIYTLQSFTQTNDILMMGMMGAGKTTLIEHLQRYVQLRYIAQGDITRSIIEHHPDPRVLNASREARPWDFDLVLEILQPYTSIPTPYVLDGLPKHPHEAYWLRDHLNARTWPTTVVLLHASRHTVLKRLRSAKRAHRSESAAEIEHRLETFQRNYKRNIEILSPALREVIEINTDKLPPLDVLLSLAATIDNEKGILP